MKRVALGVALVVGFVVATDKPAQAAHDWFGPSSTNYSRGYRPHLHDNSFDRRGFRSPYGNFRSFGYGQFAPNHRHGRIGDFSRRNLGLRWHNGHIDVVPGPARSRNRNHWHPY